MRKIKIFIIICLTLLFVGINVLEAAAAFRIIPGEYENYMRYAFMEGTSYNNEALKEEVKEVNEVKMVTYNPDNLRELSNLSRKQIKEMLEGNNLQVLADDYYEMEKKYNINAIFLMALNIEESGHGTSDLAIYKNNLGGITSRYGGYASFDSWEECLEYIASLIDEMYLTESGSYYYGTSIYDVNTKYCTSGTWADNLNTIAYELMEKTDSKADTGLYNYLKIASQNDNRRSR